MLESFYGVFHKICNRRRLALEYNKMGITGMPGWRARWRAGRAVRGIDDAGVEQGEGADM